MLVHLILSQRSPRLSSVLFILFYFIQLFRSYFHYCVFQLTASFFYFRYFVIDFFQIAQSVNNPLAMQETQVQFLGQEDSLEKEMAIHSSILAWKIPWTKEPGGLHVVHGVASVRHNLVTKPQLGYF